MKMQPDNWGRVELRDGKFYNRKTLELKMSIFTRRHYEWTTLEFIKALDACPLASDREIIWEVIEQFATDFEKQSSMFDKKLFLDNIRRGFVTLSDHDSSSTFNQGYVK